MALRICLEKQVFSIAQDRLLKVSDCWVKNFITYGDVSIWVCDLQV